MSVIIASDSYYVPYRSEKMTIAICFEISLPTSAYRQTFTYSITVGTVQLFPSRRVQWQDPRPREKSSIRFVCQYNRTVSWPRGRGVIIATYTVCNGEKEDKSRLLLKKHSVTSFVLSSVFSSNNFS
jgi:hypothetical protein